MIFLLVFTYNFKLQLVVFNYIYSVVKYQDLEFWLKQNPYFSQFAAYKSSAKELVEMTGIEPATPWMQIRCSPSWATSPFSNEMVAGTGFEPATFGLWAQRATGLLHPAPKANQTPRDLNPRPPFQIWDLKSQIFLVGLGRVELPTSRLSGVRSNQLSYRPSSCA